MTEGDKEEVVADEEEKENLAFMFLNTSGEMFYQPTDDAVFQ